MPFLTTALPITGWVQLAGIGQEPAPLAPGMTAVACASDLDRSLNAPSVSGTSPGWWLSDSSIGTMPPGPAAPSMRAAQHPGPGGQQPMRLCDNRTVLITGAGGGLGRAYALAFAAEGAAAVSYTHLDVYKRQLLGLGCIAGLDTTASRHLSSESSNGR